MSRGVIKPVPIAEMPAQYLPAANMANRLVGESTLIQVLVHSKPALGFYYGDFYKGIFYNEKNGMTVDVRLKQLLRLRLSKRMGCALCNRANEEEIRSIGFGDRQISALFDFSPDRSLFTESECALIDFADQMLLENENGRLDAALYDRLRQHFSDEQIVEISIVCGVIVGMTKMVFTLDIVPREATCTGPAPVSASRAERSMAAA